jgi:cation diffusion facilitator family transporter
VKAKKRSLTRFIWLSIAAAIFTIALKGGAYFITDSVGLLSDALESLVNLVAAVAALFLLIIAERPPDEDHAYGHTKAEYFSSGFEGGLILIAAITIGWSAIGRLISPQPIEQVGLGLVLSIIASVINLGVALVLMRAGRQYNSITLEADAHHLLTDVWTSVGVIVGIGMVALTGWYLLDSIIALLVAINIVRTGIKLIHRSALGLLDTALPEDERAKVIEILDRYKLEGIIYHALRTRQASTRRFVSMHILVPGDWTVQYGHQLLERMEKEIREALANTTVFTHIEPLEDPVSWEDDQLDRGKPEEKEIATDRH